MRIEKLMSKTNNSLLSGDAQKLIARGIERMMKDVTAAECYEPREDLTAHICDTPKRVVKAYSELMDGCSKDPTSVLKTTNGSLSFPESGYDEMITISNIDFVSLCMHHLLPFQGLVHFAYLPNKQVVGLSKVPRLVDILAHRPQVQERLTRQIVDIFQAVINPLGCAVMVEAAHDCVGCRGVRKPSVRMRTTALTGVFLTKPEVKEEFLMTALHGVR